MINQDLVLLKDVTYFGRIIRRGSTFKKVNSDEYQLWENDNGVLMQCPTIKLHFTNVSNEYFVKQYANAPKE